MTATIFDVIKLIKQVGGFCKQKEYNVHICVPTINKEYYN